MSWPFVDDLPPRVGDVLGLEGGRLGLGSALELGRLRARWRDLVGRVIAEHAEPTSLREGILRVRTDSPAWATEIAYLAVDIAGRANAALGARVVAEVRVWTSAGAIGEGLGGAIGVDPGTPDAGGKGPRRDFASRGTPRDDPRAAFDRVRKAWAARASGGHAHGRGSRA